MVRKWQKVVAMARKISSPRANECSDFNECSTSSVAKRGHFHVYSLEGKRFTIPLAYLNNVVFKELLKKSEEEFGLPSDGLITLPCDAVSTEYVLSMLSKGVSKEMEAALLSSIFMSCHPKCSTFAFEHTQQLIKITKMARKWQKVAAMARRISSPRANDRSDFSACSTSYVTEKGHFNVYTLEGKRFMIPLAYLNNAVFKELLKISEEEFGLPGDGPITLTCDDVSMEYVLSMLRRGVSQEVERALLSSIFINTSPSTCSTFSVQNTQQLTICSF
ncbi:Small auxin-up RNA protein [Dioscorea alata]|uniref:Small auxin-up RNA protein n=1 Tax=Dioscorea alata TaxID=55571 RepID=A0ACB7USM5_DIOAL|nr:Small auxin-up RNA protein [Dioscorea alata]